MAEAKAYLDSLPKVDRNEYDLRRLRHDVEADVKTLRDLHDRTAEIGEKDGKLARLKELLAGDLKGKKVLIFSTFKDTSRYLYRKLTTESNAGWLKSAGDPHIRRIDSGNHPSERPHMLGLFAPVANEKPIPDGDKEIDILISTDVLSEGQNLQDCGIIINYDLTWNPIRLVQRNGRIDRIGSPHDRDRHPQHVPRAGTRRPSAARRTAHHTHLDHRRPGAARRQCPWRGRTPPDVQHSPTYLGG